MTLNDPFNSIALSCNILLICHLYKIALFTSLHEEILHRRKSKTKIHQIMTLFLPKSPEWF